MPSVRLPTGVVTGTETAGVPAFRGLRYAVADRFGPPRPPPAGDQDGTRVGPAAPQNPDPLDAVWGATLAPGDEDCLRVNVWVPASDQASGGRQPPVAVTDETEGRSPGAATGSLRPPLALLPVVVYVHGGAFLIGSGPWGWHDGAYLARSLGCVVVSFNYRLGAFGFLDLSAFGPEFAGTGNLGLQDQLAALRWVRDQIAAFGGDPSNVTLMGQSAGAVSVACLLGSPLARGLFRRAVCLSGGPTLVRTPAFAAGVTRRFLLDAGCRTPDELRQRGVTELLAAQKRAMKRSGFGGPLFAPTVGDDVLPDFPLDTLDRSVPLLVASTRDEMRLWTLYAPQLGGLPPEALRGWLRRVVGRRAGELLRTYREAMPGQGGGHVAMAILGDAVFRLPVLRLAEAHGAAHVLRLDYRPDVPGDLGAAHALDVALLFGNFSAPGVRRLVGPTPEAARNRLRAVVGAFARDGRCDWPVYDGTRRTLLVTESLEVVADPAGAERAAWDGVPFDGRHPALDDLPRRRELALFLLGRLAARAWPWAAGLVVLGAGWYWFG